MTGEQADEIADGVAYVCRNLTDIQACLERAGDTSPLDLLLAAARNGTDASDPLEKIHNALQASGDALGVYGHTHRGPGIAPRPTGIGHAHPVEVIFLCPAGRCSRHWWPGTASIAPPTCAIEQKLLRWERL